MNLFMGNVFIQIYNGLLRAVPEGKVMRETWGYNETKALREINGCTVSTCECHEDHMKDSRTRQYD